MALIVVNPSSHILVLQEFAMKEHLGKLSGMYSIPMETAEPGEHHSVTLQRLVRQELSGGSNCLIRIEFPLPGRYAMGKTSDIMEALFGDLSRYATLLSVAAEELIRKYPDEDLAPIFRSIPRRSIAIGPVVLFDSVARDLNSQPPDEVLAALGMLCLHISTHDDLVDEPPSERRSIAALLYAGNVAALEGVRRLQSRVRPEVLDSIVAEINRNHLLQQRCVIHLWDRQPTTFAAYRRGIEHDVTFAAIGVQSGVVFAGHPGYLPRLADYCAGYGPALQLLDDIAECESDRLAGYHSFPINEGPPFAESFRQVRAHLDLAESVLEPSWRRLRALVECPRLLSYRLQETYAKS